MLIYVIMVKILRKKQTPDFRPSSETLLWPSGWHFVVATEAGRVLILLLFFCIDSRSSFCRCLRVAHTHTFHGYVSVFARVIVIYSSNAGGYCFVVVYGCRYFMKYTKCTLG